MPDEGIPALWRRITVTVGGRVSERFGGRFRLPPTPDARSARLAALRLERLAKRQDVAWHPVNVLDTRDARELYLYRPGELLVAPGALDRVEATLRSQDTRVQERRELPGGVTKLVVVGRDDVPSLLRRLERRLDAPGLVAPNHLLAATPWDTLGPAIEPDPPLGATALSAAGPEAGAGVRVAVVDTGVLEHYRRHVQADDDDVEDPDRDGDGFIDPVTAHGTFIADLVRQVVPGATVVAEQVLDRDGLVAEDDLARQIHEALRSEPHILNLSLGCHTRGAWAPIALEHGLRDLARRDDLVVVAAAGNNETDDPFWPAAFDWVTGVGAVDAEGNRAWFSNWGGWVDACALGVDLEHAYAEGTYRPLDGSADRHFKGAARWSGTSFAAPVVAAAIAARMTQDGVGPRQARDRVLADAATGPPGLGRHVRV